MTHIRVKLFSTSVIQSRPCLPSLPVFRVEYPFVTTSTRLPVFGISICKNVMYFLPENTCKIRDCVVHFGGKPVKRFDFHPSSKPLFHQPILSLLHAHIVFDRCASWSPCHGASRVLPRNIDLQVKFGRDSS